ncbi:hypothetical protein VTO42DRAFT_5105 [Malbranchea cinnamomea]
MGSHQQNDAWQTFQQLAGSLNLHGQQLCRDVNIEVFYYLEDNAVKRIYPWIELNQGNPELFTPEQLIS